MAIQDKQESTKDDSPASEASPQVTSSKPEARSKKVARPPKSAQPDLPARVEPAQKLESLVQLLKGEISTIDPDPALKIIDEFHGLVQKAKQPAAKEIANGLKELHKLLQQTEQPGLLLGELGELIGHLGEQTTQIATQSASGLKTPLQHLGKQLTKLSLSLMKSEDLEQLERLDAIVDLLEQKPKKIDLKHTFTTIDLWYEILHKSEDHRLKTIATELKSLKHLLKSSKVSSADLSQQIVHIGELTTAAATTTGRGFKGVIQKLGKVLTTFGKSLA